MQVHLITPNMQKEFTVSWLEVDTSVGNFVIKHGHAPMVLASTPKKQIAMLLTSGKQEYIEAKESLILDIQRTHITIFSNH